MITLRPYQTEAVNAAVSELKMGRHPVLCLATGTGKSLIIAAVVARALEAGQRVWVLTHIQQLIQQNADAYEKYARQSNYGIMCAALGRWDTQQRLTYGTIQTVTGAARGGELPAPSLIIVDEAHRVPHNLEDGGGQYSALFKLYPQAQRLALTATPWRMDNGLIYGEGEQFWFDELAYHYSVEQAVADGYLCPLVGVSTEVQLDLQGVTVNGDYVQREVGERETAEWLKAVATSLARLAARRRHVAVYAPTISAAVRAMNAIHEATGWSSELITGSMPKEQRAEVLFRFRAGVTKVLCSVDTITTGFDLPSLDCIVCLRPTQSSSLWVQIQGRGTRLHPEKENCLVLDYVGNLQRLGGVGMYDTYVRERGGEVEAEVEATPEPVRERAPRRQLPGLTTLKPVDPMTGEEALDGAELTVTVHAMSAVAITPRGKAQPVLMVQYTCATAENARITAARFINTERPSSVDWEFFKLRRLAVNLPSPAGQLLWAVRNAPAPAAVTVRKRGRYWNVTGEQFANTTEKNK